MTVNKMKLQKVHSV